MAPAGNRNFIVTTIDRVKSWALTSSLEPLYLKLACCSVEIDASMACYNMDQVAAGPFQGNPEQADLMIVGGTVSLKMAEELVRLYNKMPDPKFVIAFGNCAISGGPYWQHGYHVLKGIDQIIPVDIYIPGCPPRPEALIEGIRELQAKIERGIRAGTV